LSRALILRVLVQPLVERDYRGVLLRFDLRVHERKR
jgi:hypothetical protein